MDRVELGSSSTFHLPEPFTLLGARDGDLAISSGVVPFLGGKVTFPSSPLHPDAGSKNSIDRYRTDLL